MTKTSHTLNQDKARRAFQASGGTDTASASAARNSSRKNLLATAEFLCAIEKIATHDGLSLIDSIIAYCEERSVPVERVAPLVDMRLKERIRAEAQARPSNEGAMIMVRRSTIILAS